MLRSQTDLIAFEQEVVLGAIDGVVDGHIDRAEPCTRLGHERLHRARIGHVASLRDNLRAERTQVGSDLLERLHLGAGADRQIRAFARKLERCQLAHVAACSGDQYVLASEACLHACSCALRLQMS